MTQSPYSNRRHGFAARLPPAGAAGSVVSPPVAGDFPLSLSLYPRTAELRRLQGDRVELSIIQRVAAALQTPILIGAGELGDEQWMVVQPDGSVMSALLDGAALDDDRYVLRGTRSPAAASVKLARDTG